MNCFEVNCFDVCIVGFGPTGATLANLLARSGHSVVIVDRLAGVYDKPRAIHVDHEVMRIFQQIGVVEQVLPHVRPYPASEYLGVDGEVIKRLDTAPPPYPHGYAPNLSLLQPPVEEILRNRAEAAASTTLRLGHEVVAIEQDADGAVVRTETEAGPEALRARFVVGCDGANSTVRRLMGIRLDDLGFDEPWLVVDILVDDEAAMARLPAVNVQYCEPARPSTHVVGVGNHRRWEIMLLPDEDPAEAASEEGVWRHLARWIDPSEARLWRSATYRFHALVAHEWRKGHVLLAGDSAHQQPPFLGQGMCQGVRDAANLAWKLDLVLKGAASEALLDSYGAERAEHVRKLTTIIKGLGKFICERDVGAARKRDALLIAEMGGAVKTAYREDMMPRLDRGAVAASDSTVVGSLFPQPRLADGRLMDEATGTGFRLIASPAVSDAALHRLDRPVGMAVVRIGKGTGGDGGGVLDLAEADTLIADWFARTGAVAAIVRPDHYVYGLVRNEAELPALVQGLAAKLSLLQTERHPA
ncbi:bifunctional 3-(3-hydroxy-phenyl)propionate/3-hydroxycinnamic acid hydroxylase MhpA [Novosphingobium cyanobacteriorum]|uniref:Bifunctional 3-(3-hydroxy-phenyl)propionate/3-hydroxycinnamic acid hydroxylase n=1 Tax=Novosphingobium cyanobacteriorum TaxID=3024215 RepID=A0ABT6CIK1_9SPHN|nr:bifunctional 3-(3-hydroxy-phenyl)propionate/3-hydroxycinnamic acid hydroxylase [Novosphingobium cyanobacteriorum]MDF8332177.1 bifunctional 3-(3-hydroxy-phenyl)propionate/3-hydroxycinnamic acid hydroxylase [Novosphingobium cyanobacteriorum]